MPLTRSGERFRYVQGMDLWLGADSAVFYGLVSRSSDGSVRYPDQLAHYEVTVDRSIS